MHLVAGIFALFVSSRTAQRTKLLLVGSDWIPGDLSRADEMQRSAALDIEQPDPLLVPACHLAMNGDDPRVLRSRSRGHLGGLPLPVIKQVGLHTRQPHTARRLDLPAASR